MDRPGAVAGESRLKATRTDSHEQVVDRFASIRRHVRHGVVAPNKPLTLLWALDRIDRGRPRLTPFAEAEPELRELLDSFGTPGTAPGYAFWRLRNDGLWEVVSPVALPPRSGDKEPRTTALREHASGGFEASVHARLKASPALRRRVAGVLVEEHLGHRGWRRWPPGGRETRTVRQRVRDAAFRHAVKAAYGSRCVVCDWGGAHGSAPVAVDAAHVRPHGRGGPDSPHNGLPFCSLHHDLFDAGLFTYDGTRRLIVAASWRDETSGAMPPLTAFAGKPLPEPLPPFPRLDDAHLAWHRRHVFLAGEPLSGKST